MSRVDAPEETGVAVITFGGLGYGGIVCDGDMCPEGGWPGIGYPGYGAKPECPGYRTVAETTAGGAGARAGLTCLFAPDAIC